MSLIACASSRRERRVEGVMAEMDLKWELWRTVEKERGRRGERREGARRERNMAECEDVTM